MYKRKWSRSYGILRAALSRWNQFVDEDHWEYKRYMFGEQMKLIFVVYFGFWKRRYLQYILGEKTN